MHQRLESGLEQQGQWFAALTAFALVNGVSWSVSSLNIGTSWPFQVTLPLAVICIGGVKLLLGWQQQNAAPDSRRGWFARVPLRHIFGYASGMIALELVGMLRLANMWDIQKLQQVWGLALVAHIVWSVLLWPALQAWFRPRNVDRAVHKPKRSIDHLVLDDDGEFGDAFDSDNDDRRASTSDKF
jgi:hypothetical protein